MNIGIRQAASSLVFAVMVLTVLSIAPGAEKKNGDNLVELKITSLGFDRTTGTPVVLLTDKNKEVVLPIWIGLCEARSIQIGISGIVPPRPLTYDLMAAMLRTLDAEVVRIEITDIRDRVFYARVIVSVNGKISGIDARPSDALALASRMNSPIFVDKSVIRKASLTDSGALKREL